MNEVVIFIIIFGGFSVLYWLSLGDSLWIKSFVRTGEFLMRDQRMWLYVRAIWLISVPCIYILLWWSIWG